MRSFDSFCVQIMKWVCDKLGEGHASSVILPPNQFSEGFGNFLIPDLIVYQKRVFIILMRYFQFSCNNDENQFWVSVKERGENFAFNR